MHSKGFIFMCLSEACQCTAVWFFLLNCQSHSEDIFQRLNLEIKTLRLSCLSSAKEKTQNFILEKYFCFKNWIKSKIE